MNGHGIRRISIWLVTALFLLACVSPLLLTSSPTQAPQSLAPALLGTSIAQTAAAAQTQTVVYLPPSLTPTPTRFPTGTPITISSIPTFFFGIPTLTPRPSETPVGLIIQLPGVPGGGSNPLGINSDSPFTGKEWTCLVTEKSPKMGAVMQPGVNFFVSFTLLNTGTKTWPKKGVDFVYKAGYPQEGGRIQDFPKSVASGGEVTLTAFYVAPKVPDTYNSYWTLKVGRLSFCTMKISFVIK
jgi:hypothetical protein